MDKVFKTADEQIAILVKRGVTISTPDQKSNAKKALQRFGYYSIINGYNDLFLVSKTPEDQYKPGTTMEEIVAVYEFDKRLRNIMFKYILNVETNIRTLISYYFSQQYGHDNYLIYNNFDTKKKDSTKNITAVIAEVQRQLSSKYSDPAIAHYLSVYGYVPLWVLSNVLTFGQLSKFYNIMKTHERQQISRTFKILDNELESILYYISTVRNFCAHNNRLYCFRNKHPLIDLPAHKSLGIPVSPKGEYVYGKRDFYACVIALMYVLPKAEYMRLIKELYRLFSDTSPKLSVINIQDLMNEMGFPTNWRNDLLSVVKAK